VTVGYVDGFALATVLSPGERGALGSRVWAALDATCTSAITEVEVPSLIGRQLNRVAWVWAFNSLSIVSESDEVHRRAIDLGWLGAPAIAALHIAVAEVVKVDHFLTADEVTASWATIRSLDVISL
jgi:hypothetical protein